MYSIRTAIASTLLVAVAPIVAGQRSGVSDPTATIGSGPLRGRATQHAESGVTVHQFLGIPFAEPPVKGLRFEPPQEIASWDELLDARRQPNACMQWFGPAGDATDMRVALFNDPPVPGESEDCLYLNVYVPEGGESDKPVLFWIHGGSGVNGAASLPFYDSTGFSANHDIIVVATNYRLSVLGNPMAPQIQPAGRNLALLDIGMALNWTTKNIEAFGGDPEKVTIMGESAGAMAVGHLINTYPDNPPFRAGIEMSGSSVATPQGVELAASEEEWIALMKLINCTNTDADEELECARTTDIETMYELMQNSGIQFSGAGPDNVTVLERPDVAWANGNVAKVPLMIGSTADDASVFLLNMLLDGSGFETPDDPSVTDVVQALFNSSREEAEAVAEMYPPGTPFAEGANTTEGIVSQIGTDITFRCTSGFVANLTSTLLDVPVWQYVFDALVPSTIWPQWPQLGVYHASEVPLVFGTYQKDNTTEAEASLSRSLQKQFADFVKDPTKGPGWEQWPKIGVLGVNEKGAVTKSEDAEKLDAVCAYWDQLYLLSLPALSQMSGESVGADGQSGSGSNGQETGAAARTSTGRAIFGAGLLRRGSNALRVCAVPNQLEFVVPTQET